MSIRRTQEAGWLKIEGKKDRQRLAQHLAGKSPIAALQTFRVLRATDRLKDEDPGIGPNGLVTALTSGTAHPVTEGLISLSIGSFRGSVAAKPETIVVWPGGRIRCR